MYENGFLNLNKPGGISSHQAINKVKRHFKLQKIGHTGTLDPLASGILCVAVNQATKLIPYVDDTTKTYVAGMIFGYQTETQDIEGHTIEKKELSENFSETDFLSIFPRFQGEIQQIPPMFSALKKDGKKLYELAREGKTIERQSRLCNISSLKLLEWKTIDSQYQAKIQVSCSRGTYIRTLIHDMAVATGNLACMNSLERTQTGLMKIKDSYTLDEILEWTREEFFEHLILPEHFLDLPVLCVQEEGKFLIKNGHKIPFEILEGYPEIKDVDQLYIIGYKNGNQYFSSGIYQINPSESKEFSAVRIFHQP